MARNAARLGVSLRDCAPYFSAAAALMEAEGLGGEILFLNVPPCFLPGRESASIGLGAFNTVVTDPSGGKTDLDKEADSGKRRVPACRRCRLRGRCAGADARYLERFGTDGFRPLPAAAAAPARAAAPAGKRVFVSDNERCLLGILGKYGPSSSRRVLRLARGIALCRDCVDGNSVMNSARSLGEKGLVEGNFLKGGYHWRLTEKGAAGWRP